MLNSPKLSAMADTMPSVGQNRVRPSEYFRPMAQAISRRPARMRATHAVTAVGASSRTSILIDMDRADEFASFAPESAATHLARGAATVT
jgi:hypothetical protein